MDHEGMEVEDDFEDEIDSQHQEEEWEEWEDEEIQLNPTKCLFCEQVLEKPELILEHCINSHNFNLRKVQASLGLDFYQSVKLVNFIRKKVLENPKFESEVNTILNSPEIFSDDSFLQPAVEGDPLLFGIGEWDDEDEDEEVDNKNEKNKEKENQSTTEQNDLKKQIQILQNRLQEVEQSFRNYVELTQASFGNNEIDLKNLSQDAENQNVDDSDSLDYYFSSYSNSLIHEEMIKDEIRTQSYEQFIKKNPKLFKDKTVLDVGCGTSILSLFAATTGAKSVYGIDASHVAKKAKEIVEKNGMKDIVKIINGKVEEIQLPVEKVDVIISEWMGYFLLFESMLDSVIFARKKWLNDGGQVFPRKSLMYLVIAEDQEWFKSKYHFWDNVYGYDMSCMKDLTFRDAQVEFFDPLCVASNPVLIKEIDALTAEVEDLDFFSSFSIQAIKNHVCHCFVGYFDIEFGDKQMSETEKHIDFSTGPHHTSTHWKQTIFYLENHINLQKGDILEGNIVVQKNPLNHRYLDIVISYGKKGEAQFEQKFKLGS